MKHQTRIRVLERQNTIDQETVLKCSTSISIKEKELNQFRNLIIPTHDGKDKE